MKYGVKFIKFDGENTILKFKNNKIKFSTIFDYNDFNEFRYKADEKFKSHAGIWNKLKDYYEGIGFKQLCELEKSFEDFGLTREYISDLCNALVSQSIFDVLENPLFFQSLLENYVYSKVGIFCYSDIKVFDDDAAQLMFAHYADALRGVALIYAFKQSDNCIAVEYPGKNDEPFPSSKKPPTGGRANRILDWVEGAFKRNDMTDFTCKSKYWEYEHEYRIFKSPGWHVMPKSQVELKSVLYTSRISDENFQQLKDYAGISHILIEELYADHVEYKFKVYKDNQSLEFNDWFDQYVKEP